MGLGMGIWVVLWLPLEGFLRKNQRSEMGFWSKSGESGVLTAAMELTGRNLGANGEGEGF